ncbi:ABC transporter permease [Halobacteriaceae archaeon GCM10025711]
MLRRVRRHPYTGLIVNLAPSTFWLTVFFLVPLGVMFFYSFGERGAFGEVLIGAEYLGLQQYATFFVPDGATLPEAVWYSLAWILEGLIPLNVQLAATDPTPYVQLTVKSINYGILATVFSFLIGYPMAYYVARGVPEQYQNLLIALVVLPYWASYLVRVYAIKLLLAKGGILPSLVQALPFVADQPKLLYTAFSVQFGLVYVWVPFMILPAYASIENIDFTLHEAAMDLGADRLDAFLKVTFPLSLPGVIAGSILVFIPSVGSYVIPELLGSPNTPTIGEFIASQFGAAGNWPLGAAAAFVLTAIMLGAIGLYQRRAGGEFL